MASGRATASRTWPAAGVEPPSPPPEAGRDGGDVEAGAEADPAAGRSWSARRDGSRSPGLLGASLAVRLDDGPRPAPTCTSPSDAGAARPSVVCTPVWAPGMPP